MSESQIKRGILDWLNSQPGCFAKVIQVSGIRGRKSPTKGCADIVGSWNGLALAVEVKTKTGRLEESQEVFIASWTIRGRGISIVARDLDDVRATLYSPRLKRMADILRSETREISDYRPSDGKEFHATTL